MTGIESTNRKPLYSENILISTTSSKGSKFSKKNNLSQNINEVGNKSNLFQAISNAQQKINEKKLNENNINILNNNNFNNFKIENMNNIKTLNNNEGGIYCLKILDDGRLAAGDKYSNLIIYNKETFNPDIIIQNNLSYLWNFTQLKNKNIACLFGYNTLKIIKIKNNNYEDIQIIKNAHNDDINKIIELKNENLITFSWDYSFKIWKLNNNNK
jgi:hypothetical protein